ncbi:MAG: endolytic transglycosylase MltG [Oscillospiraceae bacterium]|jgi:UPF0755 protein|nr:endolytic transglycosylase MltG [Oscillospiraceae bacterium]
MKLENEDKEKSGKKRQTKDYTNPTLKSSVFSKKDKSAHIYEKEKLNKINQNLSNEINSFSNPNSENASKSYTKGNSSKPKIKKVKIPGKNIGFFRIVWIFMIAILSTVFSQCIIIGVNDMLGIYRNKTSIVVEIPKNADKNQVAKILKENGVIDQNKFFWLYALLTKSPKFIPGTFEIQTNMDYEAIINHLQSNSNRLQSDIINITIPEGKNIIEIANILSEKDICEKDEFLKACNSNAFDTDNYSFIKSLSEKKERYYKLEGYLFPDTYKFYKNEKPVNAIKKFLNNFTKQISKKTKTDGYPSKISIKEIASEKGTKIEELVTLASIIQAEAADDKDMLCVSSVLHNRLNTLERNGTSTFGEAIMGMLCADSSVWYPHKNKSEAPDGLKSKYDTYKCQGLPPGAICNPGKSAILAALFPKKTEFYYFCHNKEKKSYYAKTKLDHNINLKAAGLLDQNSK